MYLPSVLHGQGDAKGLGAGAGAGVGHDMVGSCVQSRHAELGGLVLDKEGAPLKGLGSRDGTLGDTEGGRGVEGGKHRQPRGGQFCCELFGGGLLGVDPHRHGGLLTKAPKCRGGAPVPQSRHKGFAQRHRDAIAHRQSDEIPLPQLGEAGHPLLGGGQLAFAGSAASVGTLGQSRLKAEVRPQNGIDEARHLAGHQGHRLVQGGVVGDSVQIDELIQPHAESQADGAVQLVEGAGGEFTQ